MNKFFLKFSTPNIDVKTPNIERKQAVASVFFALSVYWAIDSLSVTLKRMFEYVPPPVLIPQVLETSEETMCAGVDCSTLSETMMVPNSTRTPGRHSKKTSRKMLTQRNAI